LIFIQLFLDIQFSMGELEVENLLLGTNFKKCFIFTKLKLRENIMMEYNFSPVFYNMTVLKIFNRD